MIGRVGRVLLNPFRTLAVHRQAVEIFVSRDLRGRYINSALGLWAELGNVTGTVLVDSNYLAGGGRIMYLEQKSPFEWQGPIVVTNNMFDRALTGHGGIWGVLFPDGLPANLTWVDNNWEDGTAVSLGAAIATY